MGLWTNNGLILVATAVQTPGATAGISFVGISPGCGTLAGAIASGVAQTSLLLGSAPPAALSIGQSLTVTDGTNSETVTLSGIVVGASIPINSWTPVHSYAANTTVVVPTPSASDSALYGESQRTSVSGASAGSSAGESLVSGYFDGTQPTGVYGLVGFFGGSTATGTPGTGTLMGEDIVYWNHTVNTDTNMYQADCTI